MSKVTGKSGKRKITDTDRKLAKFCISCPVCRHARKKQQGPNSGLSKKLKATFVPSAKPMNVFMVGKPTSRLFDET